MILSGRREDALDRVKKTCEEEIAALGGGGVAAAAARVRVLPFDVADFDFVEKEAAPRALECFGRVDALVLNAGVSQHARTAVGEKMFAVRFVRRFCVLGDCWLVLISCRVRHDFHDSFPL